MVWAFLIVALVVAACVYLPMRAAAARDRRVAAEAAEKQRRRDADARATDDMAAIEARAKRDRERPASAVVGDLMRRGRP